jgi:hypothetical protein
LIYLEIFGVYLIKEKFRLKHESIKKIKQYKKIWNSTYIELHELALMLSGHQYKL